MKLEEEGQNKPKWVFPDDTSSLPVQGVFLDCKLESSKQGLTKFPVISFDSAGQVYKVSRWKTDCSACIKVWSNDTDTWIGRNVELSVGKVGFILKPIEENIAK